MAALPGLGSVDDRTLKLIAGYAREIESSLLQNQIIPSGIVDLVIMFYFLTEKFSRFQKDIAATSKNDTMISNGMSFWRSAIGNIITENASQSIFKWRFDVTAYKVAVTIGIIEYNLKINIEKYIFMSKNVAYYALSKGNFSTIYETHDHKRIVHGARNKMQKGLKNGNEKNDIIMIFNGKNKTLEYNVNGEDCGVAFKNIDLSVQYQLGICISHGVIEIVDFTITDA